ncbi:hypothetical protein JCM8097_008492 [Rhodosporidiobolus ruineniae]
MDPPAVLLGASHDVTYDATLSWDVDLSLLAVSAVVGPFPLGIPCALAGNWTLVVVPSDKDVATLAFTHGVDSPGQYGYKVHVEASFFWLNEDGERRRITSQVLSVEGGGQEPLRDEDPDGSDAYAGWSLQVRQWQLDRAAVHSAGAFEPATHRQYACVLRIRQDSPKKKKSTTELTEGCHPPVNVVSPLSGLHDTQLPHDVRLFFPDAGNGAELWASSAVLSSASPYFKDLLASDFAESVPRRSKRARVDAPREVAPPDASEKEFDDSDDETDDYLFSKRSPTLEQSSEADDVSYRQITVTQTAYSTYRAVLVYFHTGFIHFAPLRSAGSARRQRTLAAFPPRASHLPLAVSPKSTYRLAHLLQLAELQERSLAAFESRLTVDTAPFELFSKTAYGYDVLRRAGVDFVVQNPLVRRSEAWKAATEGAKRDDPGRAVEVLLELMEAEGEEAPRPKRAGAEEEESEEEDEEE